MNRQTLTVECSCGKRATLAPVSCAARGREIYVHYELPEGWSLREQHPDPVQALCSSSCRETPTAKGT